MSLLSAIEGAMKGSQTSLQNLLELRESDYDAFIAMCIDVLNLPNLSDDTFEAVLLLIKNSISDRQFSQNDYLGLKWLSLSDELKETIKTGMLSLLTYKERIMSAAAQTIAAIGKIELGKHLWDDLIPILCDNLESTDDTIQSSALTVFSFLLDDTSTTDISLSQIVVITSAVMKCCNINEKHSNNIIVLSLEALKSLIKYIEFIFDDSKSANALMNLLFVYSTSKYSQHIRFAAIEILLEIAEEYYIRLKPYFKAYLDVSINWIKNDIIQCTLFGIEFWRIIAKKEYDLQKKNVEEGFHFINNYFNSIIEPFFLCLLKQEENLDFDEWEILNSASEVFHIIIQIVDSSFAIKTLGPLLLRCLSCTKSFKIESNQSLFKSLPPVWIYRAAGFQIFSSICSKINKINKNSTHLKGFNQDGFLELVSQSSKSLINEIGYSVKIPNYPPYLTISAIKCFIVLLYHHQKGQALASILEVVIPQILKHLISKSDILGIEAAKSIEEIIIFISNGSDQYCNQYLLNNFRNIFDTILQSCDRVSCSVRNFCIEIMISAILNLPKEFDKGILSYLSAFQTDLINCLKSNNDNISNFCDLLSFSIYKTKTVLSLDTADIVMESLVQCALRQNSSLSGLKGIGLVAEAMGFDFKRYANVAIPLFLNSISKVFEQETILSSLEGLNGIIRGLKNEIESFSEDIYHSLKEVYYSSIINTIIKSKILVVFGELVQYSGSNFIKRYGIKEIIPEITNLLTSCCSEDTDFKYCLIISVSNIIRSLVMECDHQKSLPIKTMELSLTESIFDHYYSHNFIFQTSKFQFTQNYKDYEFCITPLINPALTYATLCLNDSSKKDRLIIAILKLIGDLRTIYGFSLNLNTYDLTCIIDLFNNNSKPHINTLIEWVKNKL